jgi:predicted peptidase
MRKTLLYLIAILVVVGTVSSCRKNVLPPIAGGAPPPHPTPQPQNPKLEETQPPLLIPVTKDISANIKGYYKGLPARYHESNEKYPVIIYFHGGGQYGNGKSDLPKILQEGIPKLLSEKKLPPSFTVNGEKFSFIVIAPQFVKKPSNTEIQTLIDYVKTTFRTDPVRIYLSGFSLGARTLSDYAAFRPGDIAAVTAMGGLPQIDRNLNIKCKAMVDAKLPIWQFHNRDDMAWYYSEAVRYIQVLNSYNPSIPPIFTSFDVGQGKLHHDCWTRATDPNYEEGGKNIYEWMLGYNR